MKINEKNMEEFQKQFIEKTFPAIKGKDGKGIERLKKIVEDKKKDVQERKRNRS